MAILPYIILFLSIIFPCLVFASFVPPSGKTLLLVGQDRDTIAHYVRATGNIPGGVMLYTSIQSMDGLESPVDYGSGTHDGDLLLRIYRHSVIQVGLYMVNGLDDALAGQYDANLIILAQWIKEAKRPIYLRIGYEFDLPSNRYDPEKYKRVFHYVVDFLRRLKVNNVAYVWHSQCVYNASQQWMDWYPGDDYVDYFGVSMFSTQQIPLASNFAKLAREHGKPFMICESTPWGLYTKDAKINWFRHIFQFIKDEEVNIFCYIDSNWDRQPMWASLHVGDARIEANSDVKKLWLNEIKKDRYLKSSPGLFKLLGWQDSN